MADFSRQNFPFVFKGLNLFNDLDQIPDGQYSIVTNLRAYADGSIRTRPGYASIATAAGTGGSGIQSIRRLNDYQAAAFTYIVLAGTKLFAGTSGALTEISTGFSGKPFTSAIASPYQSPRPYIYLGDSTKVGKMKVGDTTLSNWGIAAPTTPPNTKLGSPLYTILQDCESATDWTQTGTADAPSTQSRVNTTISAIAYDDGPGGFASIQLGSFVNVGRGVLLKLGGSEVVVVDEIIPGIKSTTVGTIIYDSGTTGACSIQLVRPGSKKYLRKGSLITIGGEAVTVQSASIGPTGLPSIRVITTGARSAGDAVVGLTCIRAYVTGTFAAAATVATNMVQSLVHTGLGQLTVAAAVDASAAGNRPIDPLEDEVHISLAVDKLKHLIELKIYLDVDESTNDFTKNYYWKTLSPNDFILVVDDTITTIQGRIDRLNNRFRNALQAGDFARAEAIKQKILNKQAHLEQVAQTPLDDQTLLGDSQFTELRFKTKELFRVGGVLARSLRDVQSIRVQANCSGNLTLTIDAWWIGGTYGPDVGDVGLGYHYMSRFRSSTTGARSNWSPMSRSGLEAHRQRIIVTPPTTSDAQVDRIDYARFGGSLDKWKIVGSGPTATDYSDELEDIAVLKMPDAEQDEHQPFAITDLPASGTCNVAGSTITATAGTFNVGWEKFSAIIINNVVYTLSGPPLSTTKLQINENAGTQTGVSFLLPSPLLAGQPLPCVWGPFGYGREGVYIFGVGDPKNPGTLYWTIGNNPDVQHSTGSLEVCSPGEKLMNGTVWQGRSFVFSSENLYEILPSFDTPAQFVTQKVLGAKGLFAPYALCVAPEGIYHLYKDGIYLNGFEQLTKDLYPIFPHDGIDAIAVNGYSPPNFTLVNELRMEYDDGYIYFDYKDTAGTPRYKSFLFDLKNKAWAVDFPNPLGLQVLCHYSEEGAGVHSLLAGGLTAGGVYTLYRFGGLTDDGQAITYELQTQANNLDDPRIMKLFGDMWLDFNSNNLNVSASIGFDSFGTNPTPNPQTLAKNGRGNIPIDINSGAGQLARNIGLNLSGSTSTQIISFYNWGCTLVPKSDDLQRRYTDVDDAGYMGAKFLQGFILNANTFNSAKSITVQTDNGTNGAWQDVATFSVTHNGQSEIAYSLPTTAFASSLNVGHFFRLKINDATVWELFQIKWVFEPDSELVTEWKTQQTANGQQGFMQQRDYYLSLLSTDTVTFQVIVDGTTHTYTIASTSGARRKIYIVAEATKGKSFEYVLTSPGKFRIYKSDSEVRTKSWGSSGPYVVVNPFGGPHYADGAAI